MMLNRTVHAVSLLLFSVVSVSAETRVVDAIAVEQLVLFAPRASAEVISAMVMGKQYLDDAQINTPERLYSFLSQIATETGGLVYLSENLNYSDSRLSQILGPRITSTASKSLAENPRQLANFLYSNRLGNGGKETEDGWRFRGSGFLGMAGRANFRAIGDAVDMPLEEHPEIARIPVQALKIATVYWLKRNLNQAADTGSLALVRRAFTGDTKGLDVSRIWEVRAKRVFGEKLAELGILPSAAGDDLKDKESSDIASILVNDGYVQPHQLHSEESEAVIKEAIGKYLSDKGMLQTSGDPEADSNDNLIFNDFLQGASRLNRIE